MSRRPPSDPRSPIQEGTRNGLLPALLIAGVGALVFWGSQQQGPDDERRPASDPVEAAPPMPPPPEPTAPGPARARANLAAYVTSDDYPQQAIRNNEQGTVAFVLSVSAEGRVTRCTIASGSGSAVLDAATCRLMRSRARFRPARDATGDAVPDEVRSRIRWVLPEG